MWVEEGSGQVMEEVDEEMEDVEEEAGEEPKDLSKKMVSPVSMCNYHDMTFNYFNVVLAADSI
jgi:hypothetical protein